MITYRLQFIKDFSSISKGWIGFLPEDMAVRMVNEGFAIYYIA